jgi:hypothetical protein
VTGVIEAIRSERDGDLHIRINLDAPYAGMINDVNVSQQHGDLVVEAVCVGEVTQEDAVEACVNYHNPLAIPPVGSHVRATGDYVLDRDHGWNELHPLWAIAPI